LYLFTGFIILLFCACSMSVLFLSVFFHHFI
jgi:hypothetical protein